MTFLLSMGDCVLCLVTSFAAASTLLEQDTCQSEVKLLLLAYPPHSPLTPFGRALRRTLIAEVLHLEHYADGRTNRQRQTDRTDRRTDGRTDGQTDRQVTPHNTINT